MLLGYYPNVGVFQPAAFSLPDQAGNPREFHFNYFAPYVQDDWRVGSQPDGEPRAAVGLSDNAVRNQRSHGVARRDEPARRHVHRRSVAGRQGHRRRRQFLPVLRSEQPEGPRRKETLRRDWASPGVPSATRRPSSAAGTASSTIRPKGAKSTARRTSIRTSAAAATRRRSTR